MIVLLLKVTVILLIGAVVTACMRRASAASRHIVLTASLVGALLMPVARAVMPAFELPVLPAITIPVANDNNASLSHTSGVSGFVQRATSMAPYAGDPGVAIPWLPLLGASGVIVLLLRSLANRRARRRIWADAVACPDSRVMWTADRVRGLLGLTRSVSTRLSALNTMPATFGSVSPKLLLPRDAADWGDERLDAVLTHELTHVRRFDDLAHAVARAAAALYWYHPLAWWMARQAHLERERACDDAVLRLGMRASAYAEHLLALREALPLGFGVALPMARRAHMAERLRAILDPTQRRTPHSRVSAAIAIIVIAASAVVGAALFTAPITYTSLEQIASTAQTPQQITVTATWPTPREAAPKDAEQYVRYIERGGDRPVVAPAPAQAPATVPDESPAPLRAAQVDAEPTQVAPQPIPAGNFGAGAYRPGNGVTNPIRIREVKPVYTDAALKAGLEGTVELEAVIGVDGTVTDVRVVRSLDDKLGLDENAKDVVRRTPFVPCKIGDKPVACLVVFELQFTPGAPTPIAAGQFGAGAYRFREKSGMEQPVRIRFVKPQYTPAAMRERVEGAVELEFVIQADGSVSDVRVARSLDTTFGLDEQAVKAIKATPFKPGTLNGVAVPILATASMQFTLR